MPRNVFMRPFNCDLKKELEELVTEIVTGWDMHYIILKQSVHDEISSLAFHEKNVLTVHCWVTI
jgi:hypothetical protein